ncbi:hypothetical protein BBJ29_000040 [Phytophthora kernoviae]|uniref:Uncharacterized protein n=1 Tax=Phytophthora kernoviae TaxID=325452 RepID=A0A3F2S3J1_9STRA|nr:hypothetical protein BBJ29_000040 [Phytophthora kernoviae]RLN69029.1 hypothetical protein BBP00_00000659 [Phytophthora kernoviae]
MGRKQNDIVPKSLKQSTEEVLDEETQHNSVYTRATMDLSKKEQFAWDKYFRSNNSSSSLVGVAPPHPEKDDEEESSIQANPLTKQRRWRF